ncbi:MAG TPA: ABC transporter substrate-binding protein [bacterium]|nr:ABC transporter substrate-binding protein [bacterium]
MRRRQFLATTMGVAGAIAGRGLSILSSRAAAEPVTVVLSGTVNSLDPSVDTTQATAVQYNIMEALAKYTPDHKLQPSLALRWGNINPTTWRVWLRQGIRFHDGEEFNSVSVKVSVDAFNASKGFAGSWFSFISDVRPVDNYTVDIITKDPSAVLPETLPFLYAYPPKYFQAAGPDLFGQKPMGTGPYKFVEWAKGDHITLAANSEYWGGAPQIPQLVFRTATEDSTRVAMVQTGRADLVINVPPQMIDQVQKSGVRILTTPSTRRVFVQMSMFDSVLKDVRLRKAVIYATDTNSIIQNVFGGHASRAVGILRPGMVGYAPKNVQSYGFDIQKAKDLMKEAGVPSGFKTDLFVGVGRLALDKELAEALVGQWAQAGIDVTLHAMEWGAFLTQAFSGKMPGMQILSHAPIWWDPDFTWRNQFWSKGTWKYTYTPQGDAMLEAQTRELNVAKRAVLEQALERYWLDEQAAWVVLYDQQDIYGINKKLQWTPRSDEYMYFDQAKFGA